METKIHRKSKLTFLLSLIAVLLFVYIILFEFILPANQILPRPTILLESFSSLFKDYNFLTAYLFTFSIFYSIFLISYFLIKLFFPLIIKFSFFYPELNNIISLGKYLLPLFLILLFDIWFGNSIFGEILFLLILLMGYLKIEILTNVSKVKDQYISSALSLGADTKKVVKDIYWKSFQPQIFKIFQKKHLILFSYILIYEFISRDEGLGNLIRLAVDYKDLSIIILVIILLSISLEIFELILKQIKIKFFFWESLDD